MLSIIISRRTMHFLNSMAKHHRKPTESLRKASPSQKDTLLLDSESLKTIKPLSFIAHFHGGWRTGVSLGALGVLIVLSANIVVLLVVQNKYKIQDGAAVIHQGSCDSKTKISTWSHTIINICSTLLLSASNNAMQCLVAPSREDIDRAHKKGIWLDIGIPSLRNLGHINHQRVGLWVILLLSSVPLHLL